MVNVNYSRVVLDCSDLFAESRARRHIHGWRTIRAQESVRRDRALVRSWEYQEASPRALLMGIAACVATMLVSALVLSW